MRRIRHRLAILWFGFVNSRPISQIPWSAIRRIGQSRLLALTIVVPFLGSLLLFNQYVVSFLTFSPALVKHWSTGTFDTDAVAKALTFYRLYFTYFGLSFLGIGSALFALFCPIDIKQHASAREYLQAEEPLVTKARMGLVVPRVAQAYVFWFGEDDEWSLATRLGLPEEFTSLCNQVMLELFQAAQSDHPEESIADVPDAEGDFYDRTGAADGFKIAKIVAFSPRYFIGFTRTVQELATNEAHKTDVLTLHYMMTDHSRPWLRVLVAAFYTAGFATLLWPTGLTFLQLSLRAFQ